MKEENEAPKAERDDFMRTTAVLEYRLEEAQRKLAEIESQKTED